MEKNIVIVHYNTPYLTECLVRSINLFVDNAIIYIFDNSDKYPFTAKFKKGQFITHKDKYVFELGEPWTINNCHVNVKSYANIKYKFFSSNSNYQPLCRAISFLDNARPSTKEEIEDYRISKRNAQYRHKILGI